LKFSEVCLRTESRIMLHGWGTHVWIRRLFRHGTRGRVSYDII